MTNDVGPTNRMSGAPPPEPFPQNGEVKHVDEGTTTSKLSTDPNKLHSVKEGVAQEKTQVSPDTFKENVPPASLYKRTKVFENFLDTYQMLENTYLLLAKEGGKTNVKVQIERLKDNIEETMLEVVREQSLLDADQQQTIDDLQAVFTDLDRLDRKCDEYLGTGVVSQEGPAAETQPLPLERKAAESKVNDVAAGRFAGSATSKEEPQVNAFPQLEQKKSDFDERFKHADLGDRHAVIETLSSLETLLSSVNDELNKVSNSSHPTLLEIKKDLTLNKQSILATLSALYETELGNESLEAIGSNEDKIREREGLIKDFYEIVEEAYTSSEGETKAYYRSKLESLGEECRKCLDAYDQLFAGSIKTESREIKQAFDYLQKLVGKNFPIQSPLKLAFLDFLKTESGKGFNEWAKVELKNKNERLKELKRGHVPNDIESTMTFYGMLMSSGVDAAKIPDLSVLHTVITSKVGTDPLTQPYSDGLIFAVKTPEEVVANGIERTALRYAKALKRYKTVPQAQSSPSERRFLENDSYVKIGELRRGLGILGRIEWTPEQNGAAKLTFTMRAGGESAVKTAPQSFTSTLELQKVPDMNREDVVVLIEALFGDKSRERCKKAVNEGNLKLLMNIPPQQEDFSLRTKIVDNEAFWNWIREGEKTVNPEFKAIKEEALAKLRAVVDVAEAFVNDSVVKYKKCNILLGS